jgi:hypothetical protein
MIEESLNSLMSNDAGLSAMIAGRVYAVLAPQGVKAPYIVFNLAGGQRGGTYCGSDNIQRSIFLFDSYAKTAKEAKLTARALRTLLVDYHGTVLGTQIKDIAFENEIDINDTDVGLIRVFTTLVIWHEIT